MKETLQRIIRRLPTAFLGGAVIAGLVSTAFTSDSKLKDQVKAQSVRLVVDDKPLQRDGKSGVVSFAPVVKKVAPAW